MTPFNYIRSFDLKISFAWLASVMITFGCEMKEKPPTIYKAKPVDKISAPKEEPKKEIAPADSVTVPVDSIQKIMKDTTETLHRIEKKPEIKISRRFFHLNIHKRAFVVYYTDSFKNNWA